MKADTPSTVLCVMPHVFHGTSTDVTVTSVLVPWNTCGMTQSTVLGVPTFTYLPFCFFNIISPIMSVVVAALGYKIFKCDNVEVEE